MLVGWRSWVLGFSQSLPFLPIMAFGLGRCHSHQAIPLYTCVLLGPCRSPRVRPSPSLSFHRLNLFALIEFGLGSHSGWTVRLGILRAVVRLWGVPFCHHVQQVYNGAAVQV